MNTYGWLIGKKGNNLLGFEKQIKLSWTVNFCYFTEIKIHEITMKQAGAGESWGTKAVAAKLPAKKIGC